LPSVSRLRLVPLLPFTVEPFGLVVLQHSLLPFLEAVMYCAFRTQAARQRLPLAASTQNIKNGSHRLQIVHARSSWLFLRFGRWEQGFYAHPKFIWNLVLRVNTYVLFCRIGSLLHVLLLNQVYHIYSFLDKF